MYPNIYISIESEGSKSESWYTSFQLFLQSDSKIYIQLHTVLVLDIIIQASSDFPLEINVYRSVDQQNIDTLNQVLPHWLYSF